MIHMEDVEYIRLDEEARCSEYKTENAAGADLYSIEDVIIPPEHTKMIGTGLAMQSAEQLCMLILPRSGHVKDTDFDVKNAPGLIV